MKFLTSLWTIALDLLFGKSEIEEEIRSFTEEEFLKLMRPLPWKDGVTSLFRYENPLIHEMIYALKYRGNQHVAKLFASALGFYLTSRGLTDHLIIPIPLSKKRRTERGFNQVELVLQNLTGVTITFNVLKKVRDTKPQTTLHRAERIKNLENAFTVSNPGLIKGKNVVLVDDVTTTGTTLKEASRVLRDAGAKSVQSIALTRGDSSRRNY
jgi:competence protein ComFC